MKVNNYINHVLFVIDKSGSMSHLTQDVIRVFDSQIEHLAKRSRDSTRKPELRFIYSIRQ